jgi:predicted nucleic acid-binding protein
MDLRTPVFLDTTVLSNYASSDSIDHLVAVLDRPATVPSVRAELEAGRDGNHTFLHRALDELGTGVRVVEERAADGPRARLRERLDRGEADALAAAIRCGGSVATDDMAARNLAHDHDIPVTGSLGLLVLGVRRGIISMETANGWLETWREERGYYSPVSGLSDII